MKTKKMNNQYKSNWEKFLDPKKIKMNLLDTSLFLASYEILKSSIIERIADFYCMEYKNGKRINSKEYKNQIINRKTKTGKANTFISSCDWLLNNNMITQEDHKEIERITDLRNDVAHDLPKFLMDTEYNLEKDNFEKIKMLTLKIEKWWIALEIDIDPEFDNVNVELDKIVTGKELILDYIYNVANTDLDKLEQIIDKASKEN